MVFSKKSDRPSPCVESPTTRRAGGLGCSAIGGKRQKHGSALIGASVTGCKASGLKTPNQADFIITNFRPEGNFRTHLKNVFWPHIFVGASFQILDILQYACGLKLGSVAILNQNPIFEMASNHPVHLQYHYAVHG